MKNTNKNSAKLLVLSLTLALFSAFFGCSQNSSDILGVNPNDTKNTAYQNETDKKVVLWQHEGFDVITENGFGKNYVVYSFIETTYPKQVKLQFMVETPAEKLGYNVSVNVNVSGLNMKKEKETGLVNGLHIYNIDLTRVLATGCEPELKISGILQRIASDAQETGMKIRKIKLYKES